MKKSILEELDLLSCALLQKNEALGVERKAALDVGFIRSQVVVGRLDLEARRTPGSLGMQLCSSILFAEPT